MKPQKLTKIHADLSWELINDMSPAELDLLLESQNYSPSQVNTLSTLALTSLNSKASLALARQKRLSDAVPQRKSYDHLNATEILQLLVQRFGSLDRIPMAARNFEELHIQDLRELAKELLSDAP